MSVSQIVAYPGDERFDAAIQQGSEFWSGVIVDRIRRLVGK